MIRKHAQFFASLLWAFDMTLVSASFGLAHLVRFDVLHTDGTVQPFESLLVLVLSVVVFTFVFRWSGLYHSHRLTARSEEVFNLFKATALSLLVVVFAHHYLRDVRYSRLTLLIFGGISFVALASTRALARQFLAGLRRRGFNLRSAVIVGTGELARAVADRLERRPEYGIHVRGFVATDGGPQPDDLPVLGPCEELESICGHGEVDQVYIALPMEQHARLKAILDALSTSTADVKVVPDLYEYMTLRGGVEEVDGLPVVALQHGPVHGWDAVAKRTFDLAFGLPILLLAAPVMLVTALLIKITSPGPVFYGQERMGLDGKPFHIFKFRSMRHESQGKGFRRTTADDDRITAVGRFIRKTSIDELPQIFNVLRGEMSLVGPRPDALLFIEKEHLMREVRGYNLRYKVKAGMTGLAQVEGVRGLAPLHKRVERDLYYIEHWSLWLDFKILVRTALGGFLSRNAY